MRLPILIFILSLSFAAPAAFADNECGTIDLNEEVGKPYDQGETAWCTYHSTAAVISQEIKMRVSPGALAAMTISASEAELDRLPSPELLKYSVEHALKAKIVLPDEIPSLEAPRSFQYSMLKTSSGRSTFSHNGIMSLAGREDLALLIANLHGVCPVGNLPDGYDEYLSYLSELDYVVGKVNSTNLSPLKLTQKVLRQWTKMRCQGMTRLTTPLVPDLVEMVSDEGNATEVHFRRVKSDPEYLRNTQDTLFAALDRNLERHKVSAIGYNACEHERPDYILNTCLPGTSIQEHSGVVTARTRIDGQCRYFVRTHRGTDCEFYKSQFKDNKLCERRYGGIWVNRDELKTIYSVFSIK